MTAEIYRQRRNVLVLSVIIIFLDLANYGIPEISFSILKNINLETEPILGFISTYNVLLVLVLIVIFLRYVSSYIEHEKENYKKKSYGKFYYYGFGNKAFGIYSDFIESILKKEIYEIGLPAFLFMVIIVAYILDIALDFEVRYTKIILSFIMMSFSTIAIIIFEKYSKNKKKTCPYENKTKNKKEEIRLIRKNKKIIELREMYNKKKKKNKRLR